MTGKRLSLCVNKTYITGKMDLHLQKHQNFTYHRDRNGIKL